MARGVWLNGHDGQRYLDAISSWWVNLFGHANPRISAAVAAQLAQLEHVIFAGFTHEPAIELAEALTRLAPPGLTRCFFADNGSAAVEVAVKMSFHYWRNSRTRRQAALHHAGQQLSRRDTGRAGRRQCGALQGHLRAAADGRDHGALARLLSSASQVKRWAGLFNAGSSRPCATLLERHAHEAAAVIVEPLVQCAGGMRMYHPVYLKLLRQACDEFGVHLIADEIAVGFGRTGTLFACEQAGITPDFMCLSKGLTGGYLPLSAVLTDERRVRRPSTTSTRSSMPSCIRTATPAIRWPAPRRAPRWASSTSEPVHRAQS